MFLVAAPLIVLLTWESWRRRSPWALARAALPA
jgi:hypothetical protein